MTLLLSTFQAIQFKVSEENNNKLRIAYQNFSSADESFLFSFHHHSSLQISTVNIEENLKFFSFYQSFILYQSEVNESLHNKLFHQH
jgi:hypothetical protein